MQLAICVPARNQCETPFAFDLAELYALTKASVPTTLVPVVGTVLHQACERALEDAIRFVDATHVLWLDTDMRFPADAALRLLRHGVDVVAANCTTRVHPPQFCARRDGCVVPSGAENSGLEAVDRVGMGVLLMRTSVLAGVPRPWFFYDHPDQTPDFRFCDLIRRAGHSIYIDHDLSREEVGHIGQFTFYGRHVAPVHV